MHRHYREPVVASIVSIILSNLFAEKFWLIFIMQTETCCQTDLKENAFEIEKAPKCRQQQIKVPKDLKKPFQGIQRHIQLSRFYFLMVSDVKFNKWTFKAAIDANKQNILQ